MYWGVMGRPQYPITEDEGRHTNSIAHSPRWWGTVKINKNKRELYKELIDRGWPITRIAKSFGVTKQAVYYMLNPQSKIPAILKFHANARDRGLCSLCGVPTKSCCVVDKTQPITFDNIGMLCGKCSRMRSNAMRPHKPLPSCRLAGCSNLVRAQGVRYCCPEHRYTAREDYLNEQTRQRLSVATKSCSVCGLTKSTTEFYPAHHGKSYSSACKPCNSLAGSARRKELQADKTSPEYLRRAAMARINSQRYFERMRSTPEGTEILLLRQRASNQRSTAKVTALRRAAREAAAERAKSPEVQAALDKLRKIL